MKRLTLRETLATAAVALTLIFSGFGVGVVVTRRQTPTPPQAPLFALPSPSQPQAWQQKTLSRLDAQLSLNSYQKQRIAEELERSSRDFTNAYNQTLSLLKRRQIRLLQDISPHLTQEQLQKIDANYAKKP